MEDWRFIIAQISLPENLGTRFFPKVGRGRVGVAGNGCLLLICGGAVIRGWVKVLWCTELLLAWATQEQLAGPGGGHQESDLQQNLKIYLKRPILGSTTVMLPAVVMSKLHIL